MKIKKAEPVGSSEELPEDVPSFEELSTEYLLVWMMYTFFH